MLYGSTMAVRQKDLKRMMASSGVAHAGYLLAGKGNLSPNRLNAMAFYFFSYLFMMAGIFAIVLFLEKKSESPKQNALAGLYRVHPLTAAGLTFLLLSLAGIPGTAGFVAKFKILLLLLSGERGHWLAAGAMIRTTVLSYVYYFGLAARVYSAKSAHKSSFPETEPLPQFVLALSVISTVFFGLFPDAAAPLLALQ